MDAVGMCVMRSVQRAVRRVLEVCEARKISNRERRADKRPCAVKGNPQEISVAIRRGGESFHLKTSRCKVVAGRLNRRLHVNLAEKGLLEFVRGLKHVIQTLHQSRESHAQPLPGNSWTVIAHRRTALIECGKEV